VLIVIAAATPLVLVAGHATISRAFWVVAIFAVFFGALLMVMQSRHWLWIPVVAALFATALGAAAEVMARRGDGLTYFEDRSPIVAAVTTKILSNPSTGTGFGHQTDQRWYEATFPKAFIYHPHNIILGFMDQMGVVGGAVALLAVFAFPALAFLRHLRGPRRESIIAITGLVLVASVFLRNNADFVFLKQNAWMYFAYLGMLVGELHRAKSQESAISRQGTGTNGPNPQ
jgi:O-antigen ligase